MSFHSPSYSPLAILLASLFLVGCGGSSEKGPADQEQTSTTDGGGASTHVAAPSAADELFPQPKFDKIEFTAKERPKPTNVEEAKGTVEQIKKLYDWSNVPPALNEKLTLESVYQFVKSIKLIQSQVPHDVAWLKALDGEQVPGADKFEAQSINNARDNALQRLEMYLPRDIEHSTKYTREFIVGSLASHHWMMLEKGADCDMSDQSQVRNTLGRDNINQLRADSIRRLATAIEAAILFDKVLGVESDFSDEKKRFRELVGRYEEKLRQAADAIQPPQDIGDSTLAGIADEVLKNPKYKLGEIVRVIVNAPKKPFGKDHYTIDFGERSIEKSPYRWEEFQAATIEKEGDQHYLYYNTIIKYSVGPHTVPTGQWVLGPRHMSAPISAENINN